jgi:uncharacterized protein (TIGR00730 family)
MAVEQKRVRKFLSKKIQQLNDIVADLDSLVTELGSEFYRVSIFGSARIKPDTDEYKQVYTLAKELSRKGVDIVTGGGPGLMEAANLGAKEGGNLHSRSFGLHIELPFETDTNSHLDVKYHHRRFSSRLDEFMRISHAVVVTPGGIGTLLELFYTWQLMQVNHIAPRPFILLGPMWEGLLDWMEKYPLNMKLMDKKDFQSIVLVRTVDDVVNRLAPEIQAFYANQNAVLSEDRKN